MDVMHDCSRRVVRERKRRQVFLRFSFQMPTGIMRPLVAKGREKSREVRN